VGFGQAFRTIQADQDLRQLLLLRLPQPWLAGLRLVVEVAVVVPTSVVATLGVAGSTMVEPVGVV
jgi:hypothetical protein